MPDEVRQGGRKHLKLGGAQHFEGTFFLKKRGHFLEIKRALHCLLQNLGGRCPQCPPVPMSMRSGKNDSFTLVTQEGTEESPSSFPRHVNLLKKRWKRGMCSIWILMTKWNILEDTRSFPKEAFPEQHRAVEIFFPSYWWGHCHLSHTLFALKSGCFLGTYIIILEDKI